MQFYDCLIGDVFLLLWCPFVTFESIGCTQNTKLSQWMPVSKQTPYDPKSLPITHLSHLINRWVRGESNDKYWPFDQFMNNSLAINAMTLPIFVPIMPWFDWNAILFSSQIINFRNESFILVIVFLFGFKWFVVSIETHSTLRGIKRQCFLDWVNCLLF